MSETIAQSQSENYSRSVGTSAVVLVKGGGNDQSGSGIATVGGTINVPRSVVVHNAHASQVLYAGWGSDVTSSSGFPIAAGGYMEFELLFTDELWAVGSGADTDARVYVLHGKGITFSPLELSPVLWVDASDTSTISDTGGSVDTWADKSGNGYHLTQGTAALQPKSGTATINGLNVVEYDGANTQYLLNASMPWAGTSLTVFAVYEINPLDTQYIVAATHNSAGYLYIAVDNNATPTSSGSMTSTSLYVDGVEFTGTTYNDVYDFVGNSPAIVRVTGTSVTYDGINVGYYGGGTGASRFGYGDKVGEMIVVETPTAGQIADTETYLANKWGITI